MGRGGFPITFFLKQSFIIMNSSKIVFYFSYKEYVDKANKNIFKHRIYKIDTKNMAQHIKHALDHVQAFAGYHLVKL